MRTARNLRVAADAAGLSLAMLQRRRRVDAEFAAQWAEARDEYVLELGSVTRHDAVHGYVETRTTRRAVEGGGLEVVEEVEQTRIDNSLRLAVLARLAPEEWGKRDQIDLHVGGANVKQLVVDMDSDPNAEDPD